MARLHIHPVGLGLIFFGLLSWVVALGGLGASTKYCNDNRPADDPSYCARLYQLEWWSVWFEFFLLLCMLLTCFTNAFDRARFIYLTYLAMVTVLLTSTTRNFVTNTFNYNKGQIKLGDRKSDAYNAVAAGGIMLCITNYALIIFVGLGASTATPQSQGYQPTPLSAQGFGLSTFGLGMGMGSSAPQPAPLPTQQPQTVEKYQPSNF